MIKIEDLPESRELDREAMKQVCGGQSSLATLSEPDYSFSQIISQETNPLNYDVQSSWNVYSNAYSPASRLKRALYDRDQVSTENMRV